MKIALRPKKRKLEPDCLPWKACLPFVENMKGMLLHRPKEVSTYLRKNNSPWHGNYQAVHYWCGNLACGGENLVFLSAPPKTGKLLCLRCEIAAVASGLPTADELAGFHVHKGKLKAIRTCCTENEK